MVIQRAIWVVVGHLVVNRSYVTYVGPPIHRVGDGGTAAIYSFQICQGVVDRGSWV